MSTNCTIAIIKKDNTIHSISCHWDGFLEINGLMLHENYQSSEKVIELIKYGNLSILCKEINPPQDTAHSFSNPIKDVCIYYSRDRKESGNKPQIYDSLENYSLMIDMNMNNYIYKEKNKTWYVLNSSCGLIVDSSGNFLKAGMQKLESQLLKSKISDGKKQFIRSYQEKSKLHKKIRKSLQNNHDTINVKNKIFKVKL